MAHLAIVVDEDPQRQPAGGGAGRDFLQPGGSAVGAAVVHQQQLPRVANDALPRRTRHIDRQLQPPKSRAVAIRLHDQ